MGGDGMGGFVLVMMLAIMAMVAIPAIVFALVSRRLSRGKSVAAQVAIVTAAVLVGVGGGVAWVTATFFETTWAPPPRVTLQLPANFAHASVIFLEQASATRELNWLGTEMPLTGKSVAVNVPPSGVVRLRSLDGLITEAFTVDSTPSWRMVGTATGPVRGVADTSSYIVIELENSDVVGGAAPPPDTGLPFTASAAALMAHVQQRELAAQNKP